MHITLKESEYTTGEWTNSKADVSKQLDYSEILAKYGVAPLACDQCYWQIGEINKIQGWILHISTIKVHIDQLFLNIIPLLLNQNVAFKIIRDCETASRQLDGLLGYHNIGKILRIYPTNDEAATQLALKLIPLSRNLRGPSIPTDRHLGGTVFTRYGSFNPILTYSHNGSPIKCIYNHNNQLVPDRQSTPFCIPAGINWPFTEITSSLTARPSRLLNDKYYIIQTIKPDAKGKVSKAIYFRKPWLIDTCIIKEGKANMAADDMGRDIRSRLHWQYDLSLKLQSIVPIPRVTDIFYHDHDCYLVTTTVKGTSLNHLINQTYKNRSWHDISLREQRDLLAYMLQILKIVDTLHKNGIVHRDLNPENFIVNSKKNISLIDFELAYSITSRKPLPPFSLGSPGFMSPEQFLVSLPTIQEDIFALGGILFFILTGMLPIKLNDKNIDSIARSVHLLTSDPNIALDTANCFNENPADRPAVKKISESIKKLQENSRRKRPTYPPNNVPITELDNAINLAIRGMTHRSMLDPQGLWFSKNLIKETQIGNEQWTKLTYRGWHTGIAGPLWAIAKALRYGFNIDNCRQVYNNNLISLISGIPAQKEPAQFGLYYGTSGAALAVSEALHSGTLEFNDELQNTIAACFSEDTSDLSVAAGLAGQGLSLLASRQWLPPQLYTNLLRHYVRVITSSQNHNGSWPIPNRQKNIPTFDTGVSGIISFLLKYIQHQPDPLATASALRGLHWLAKKIKKSNSLDIWNLGGGMAGITSTFIGAYRIFHNQAHKLVAETLLNRFPSHPLHNDFTLSKGLSGIGYLFLQAAEAFNDKSFETTSFWIANVLTRLLQVQDLDHGYWATDNSTSPTADLGNGMSGILFFLLQISKFLKTPNSLSSKENIS